MTLDDFKKTLSDKEPPAGLTPVLLAMWHDGHGNWKGAHDVAQDIPDPDGAWVHAYLHREEGEAGNAAYWYRRAGKPVATGTLSDEWDAIVTASLS